MSGGRLSVLVGDGYAPEQKHARWGVHPAVQGWQPMIKHER
jgi:hypothetical protein